VGGGSHYVMFEYPELINLRLEKFFHESGYAGEAVSAEHQSMSAFTVARTG
jgi:hypothetical protein